MTTITAVTATDVRFPTSLTMDGSDAMNKDGDYGLVQCGQADREPPAHAVREAGGHAVCDVTELEPLQQVARPVLPVVEPAQPGRQLNALPGRRARHQAAARQ